MSLSTILANQVEIDNIHHMIRDKTAIICQTEWVVDGSKVKGRQKTNQHTG